MQAEKNVMIIQNNAEQSRLIECLGFPPIKFINPKSQSGTCQVYMANYGGGLVDGDSIRLQVECQADSKLYLGTQSSTKVYRSEGKGGCRQEIFGKLGANSLAIICPDPVVPFADSIYKQSQNWEVDESANLIVFDWLQPGRTARGEIFNYQELSSDISVQRPDGKKILREKFKLVPSEQNPFRCGQFGAYQSLLAIYLIGSKAQALGEGLEKKIMELNLGYGPDFHGKNVGKENPKLWIGIGKNPNVGMIIRALGEERRDLQPLQDLIFTALSDKKWLGFNPWLRRW